MFVEEDQRLDPDSPLGGYLSCRCCSAGCKVWVQQSCGVSRTFTVLVRSCEWPRTGAVSRRQALNPDDCYLHCATVLVFNCAPLLPAI